MIGTHALLSAGVQFADLGLVVVDEQHRFGVEQRAALNAKAAARPHVLVMTATPIPRSVAMTVFGDLETATLRELPAGRAEVSTVVVDAQRQPAWVQRAWQRIVEEVGRGRQAYVVCARISTGDVDQGAAGDVTPAVAVEDLFAELRDGPLSERPGGDAARPAAQRAEGGGDEPLRRRPDRRAGGDHGDRGGGGRTERVGDGDQRRRPVRHLPAAPAARPDRPRRASRGLPAAHHGRGEEPRPATAGGGGRLPATASRWPRSTCSSGARGTCSEPASRAAAPA